jgi:hypothetical protein
MLPTKFGSFGHTVSEKIFLEINQCESKLTVAAMFDNVLQHNDQIL